MDADSEATADMEEAEAAGEAAVDQPQLSMPVQATAAAAAAYAMPDVSASAPASTRDMDYEIYEDDDGASEESDGEQKALAAVQAHAAMRASKPPSRRCAKQQTTASAYPCITYQAPVSTMPAGPYMLRSLLKCGGAVAGVLPLLLLHVAAVFPATSQNVSRMRAVPQVSCVLS
jgi:hypothetical protein